MTRTPLLDHPKTPHNEDPHRQGKGADQSRDHDGIGGYGALMAVAPCHDKGGDGRRRSEHDDQDRQLFLAETDQDGNGKEYCGPPHKL